MVTRVLMFGTFDILHEGHKHILKEAQKHGDELYVVIALDSTVEKVKHKAPVYDQETRRKNVQALPEVTRAVLGNEGDKYKVVEEIQPDIILLGYDQLHFVDSLEEELEKRQIHAKIVRLKPYKEDVYKSSLIRKKMGL